MALGDDGFPGAGSAPLAFFDSNWHVLFSLLVFSFHSFQTRPMRNVFTATQCLGQTRTWAIVSTLLLSVESVSKRASSKVTIGDELLWMKCIAEADEEAARSSEFDGHHRRSWRNIFGKSRPASQISRVCRVFHLPFHRTCGPFPPLLWLQLDTRRPRLHHNTQIYRVYPVYVTCSETSSEQTSQRSMYSGPAKGKKHALSFIDYSKCEEALKRAMPLSRLVHRTTSSPRVCILFAICRPILKCRMFQKKIHRACVALRMATRLDVNTHESASLIIHRQEAEKGKEKNKYIYAKNLNIIKKVDFVISTKSKELFFFVFFLNKWHTRGLVCCRVLSFLAKTFS